jgi:predicted ATP-grasp superfamily ATP-dependent carboligase
MGNVIEYYTNDYKDTWVANNFTSGSYVADDIEANYYPTPHISIGVDIANTDKSIILSTNDTIQKALQAVESIRPANVVVDGIIGFAGDIKLPDVTVSLKFCSTKVIAIGRENQQTPFKA